MPQGGLCKPPARLVVMTCKIEYDGLHHLGGLFVNFVQILVQLGLHDERSVGKSAVLLDEVQSQSAVLAERVVLLRGKF